ncbi:MAG: type II secretion system F family protein [Desulfovibrionaceae bacterium]|nr:type II secretion system F family protein [Desulfovibrionaceae bacterium]
MLSSSILPRLSFSATVRLRTWKKLSAQVRHGLNLSQSLKQMQARAAAQRSPTAVVFAQVSDYLGRGHNLGASLTGFATPEEIMLISSGQRAGRLPEGLDLAAGLLAARQTILRAVAGALIYPAFLMAMVAVVLLVVSVLVMPKLAMLSDPTAWHGPAALMYMATSFVTSPFGVATFVLLLAGLAAILITLPRWTGRWRLSVEQIPPWSIYRLTVGCVWLYTLSTLMRSGMQLTHIFDSMMNSDHITAYLRERVALVAQETGTGKNLGEALFSCGMEFPDSELVEDLRVYASLPGFHVTLHNLAEEWLVEGVEHVKRQARILNVVAIIMLSGIVSLIAASIGSLQSQLIPAGGF